MKFTERTLGKFKYRVLEDPTDISIHLRIELVAELEQDQREFPDQQWTPEWLNIIKTHQFELRQLDLDSICPRKDLMNWETDTYSFAKELKDRVDEARPFIGEDPFIEPLVVREGNLELIDGHMRYTILNEWGEAETYAYVARTM